MLSVGRLALAASIVVCSLGGVYCPPDVVEWAEAVIQGADDKTTPAELARRYIELEREGGS